MKAFKVRDGNDAVIAQYYQHEDPDKPDEWDGEWNVEEVPLDDLNSESAEWWDESF